MLDRYHLKVQSLFLTVGLFAGLSLVHLVNPLGHPGLYGQEEAAHPKPQGAASGVAEAPDENQQVRKLAQHLAGESRGALVLVRFADGTEWSGVAGSRSEGGPPVTGKERFAIGSVTKLFTAVAILQLEERGLLDLDAPLADFFDRDLLAELVGREQGDVDKLKVRHLLSHTTGMGDYINIGSDADAISLYGTDGKKVYKPAELVELTRRYTEDPSALPKDHPPLPCQTLKGLEIDDYDAMPGAFYSNTGYIMLGMIIEKVSGAAYEDYLTEQVLQPLGLKETGFGTRGAKPDFTEYATGVVDGPIGMSPSFAWSAGEIVTTGGDLATFFSAAFAGKLFQKETTLQFWKTQGFRPLMGIPMLLPEYGHGLMRKSIGKYVLYGHDGQTFGATALVAYCPECEATIVIARNDSQNSRMWSVATAALAAIVAPKDK